MKKQHSFLHLATALLLAIITVPHLLSAQAFVHPGAMHKQSDFDRMKSKVAAQAQPWYSGWQALQANSHATSSYVLKGPVDTVYRGTGYPENYSKLFNDIAAGYANALEWKVTGTTAYAAKAAQIMKQWGSTLKVITGTSDKYLAAGIYGYEFANVAEIMRDYRSDTFTTADFNQFKTMMLNVFYPMNHDFLVNHNGACITHYWANWDICNMASVMAIGILCDDRTKYNEAVTYFQTGAGNGSMDHAVYYVHPDSLGQWQESGRDQGHNTLGVALMGPVCEMAWSQGDDLYGYNTSKFLKGLEYIAKYNLNDSVPYVTYNNCDNVNQTVISATSRGNLRDCWEMVYNHYVNRKGLTATYTSQFAALVRPEGGGGHYDTNSGGYDQLGYGTLTYSLAPVSTTLSPVADAYVQTGTYANTNFGTATSIVTKAGTGDGYREGYLRFDLSGISGNLTNAKLRLYAKSKEGNSTRSIYTVATDTWGETTITYNNKPAYASAIATDSITALGWVEFDISNYIMSEYAGDQLASICIKDPVTNNNIGTDFYSKEWTTTTQRPQLVITSNATSFSVAPPIITVTPDNTPTTHGLQVYPNPVSNGMVVRVNDALQPGATLNIYNANGVLVNTRKLNSVQVQLSTNGLVAGAYLVELVNGDTKQTQKVIKVK